MTLRLTETQTINIYEHGSLSDQYKTLRMRANALVQELRELVAGNGDTTMTVQELSQIADLIEELLKERSRDR